MSSSTQEPVQTLPTLPTRPCRWNCTPSFPPGASEIFETWRAGNNKRRQ